LATLAAIFLLLNGCVKKGIKFVLQYAIPEQLPERWGEGGCVK